MPRRQITSEGFEEFFEQSERPVRFALSAKFGFEVGREAAAEALTQAWEHWDRIHAMENPAGYVYRIGERIGSRISKRPQPFDQFSHDSEPRLVEPKLRTALTDLSPRQRTSVVLVHGLGWTHDETAAFLSISSSSVQKHVERGLRKLRKQLGVDIEP